MKAFTIIILSILVIGGILITLIIERDKYNGKRGKEREMD